MQLKTKDDKISEVRRTPACSPGPVACVCCTRRPLPLPPCPPAPQILEELAGVNALYSEAKEMLEQVCCCTRAWRAALYCLAPPFLWPQLSLAAATFVPQACRIWLLSGGRLLPPVLWLQLPRTTSPACSCALYAHLAPLAVPAPALPCAPLQAKTDERELEELREMKADVERKEKQQAAILELQVRVGRW